jgi:site-specific recombinase XerD
MMRVEEKEVMTNNVSTLTKASNDFTRSLTGRNISPHTITTYTTDLRQFIAWTAETDISVTRSDQVAKFHRVESGPGRSTGQLLEAKAPDRVR